MAPSTTTTSPSLKRKAVDLAEAEHKKPKQDGSITAFFGAPKKAKAAVATSTTTTTATDATKESTTVTDKPATTTLTTKPTSASKFDKATWAASLTPDQRSLLQLELDTLDETWLAALAPDLLTPSFLSLKRFLRDEHAKGSTIFPPAADVYSWSRHTPLGRVKAVVLGQDPYFNPRQAHGLCFSVRPPTPAPPSLKNVYKALVRDYPAFKAPPGGGGLLTPWADRGVLLLNTCLTVRAGTANSHAGKGWEGLTQRVIELVAKRGKGVVFLAWGKPAQARCKGVDRKKHLVLESVHPSPLSAMRGFFECGHFKKTNEWLRQRYGEGAEIDWDLNVDPEEAGV